MMLRTYLTFITGTLVFAVAMLLLAGSFAGQLAFLLWVLCVAGLLIVATIDFGSDFIGFAFRKLRAWRTGVDHES